MQQNSVVSNPIPGDYLYAKFSSNPDQPHMNHLIEIFMSTWLIPDRCVEAGLELNSACRYN